MDMMGTETWNFFECFSCFFQAHFLKTSEAKWKVIMKKKDAVQRAHTSKTLCSIIASVRFASTVFLSGVSHVDDDGLKFLTDREKGG